MHSDEQELNLGKAMAEIRAAATEKVGNCELASSLSDTEMEIGLLIDSIPTKVVLPRLHQPEPFESKSEYSVNDFLRFYGEEFLDSAYRGILKREPDDRGRRSYLTALGSGRLTRLELLGRLRYSREGRRERVAISGLRTATTLHRVYSIPVLGYCLRMAVLVARLPAVIRHLQHQTADALRRDAEMRREADRANALIVKQLEAIASAISGLGEIDIKEYPALRQAINKLKDVSEDAKERATGRRGDRIESLEDLLNIFGGMTKESEGKIAHERSRLDDMSRQVLLNRRSVVDNQRRLNLLLDEMRKPTTGDRGGERHREVAEAEQDHILDAMYVSFEDQFRGSREEIKERQKIYLPYVTEVVSNRADGQVIDIGCGRGEWLELLQQSNIPARGIDLNRILIDECRQRGLDVVESEALDYLRQQKPNTVAVISGFHIIEHVPTRYLVALFDEALRALAPGGVLIVETPNPANVLVGSNTFYMDPTHRNPLPVDLTRFLLEARGFSDVEVMGLHPYPEVWHAQGSDSATQHINRHFYGPQDYAAIGYKA
ncbi:MAG TPA: methyltransferase domain-containing protein [Gammaproteobacteria bacterium]|nr:methyltransferase domain-containing protein [Gammaproteobacteria bacterium]